MKPTIIIRLRNLVAVVMLTLIIGCSPQVEKPKEEEKLNKLPVAYAGESKLVFPTDTVLLDGRYSSWWVTSFEWKKISGPASVIIDNANSSVATLRNLQGGGIYNFELTVTDNNNNRAKDTVTISVFEFGPGAREANFKNLVWIDFWGYYLGIGNLNSFVPAGASFRVFVKSYDDPGWIEVVDYQQWRNEKYKYTLFPGGDMDIESSIVQRGTADVKIVY